MQHYSIVVKQPEVQIYLPKRLCRVISLDLPYLRALVCDIAIDFASCMCEVRGQWLC